MKSGRQIRAVTFDLDGLMFNTEDLYDEVTEELLLQRGKTFSLELKHKMMGLPGLKAMAALCDHCGLDEPGDGLLQEVHDRMFECLPRRLEPMPGLSSLLDLLDSRNLPLGIATSSSRRFLDTTLQISGLGSRFRFSLCAEDVERGKPWPDIYEKAAALHGVPTPQMLVFEDSVIGSRAAAASGAWTVAVPAPRSANCDFSHADLVVASLEAPEIAELFGT